MDSVIKKAEKWMRIRFSEDKTGHDFEHLARVARTAAKLQATEGGNALVIQLAALFHDYPDEKLVSNTNLAKEELIKWMEGEKLSPNVINDIMRAINAVSYRGGSNPIQAISIEEKIVQDADRLDALGAIGIIRAFTYGASKKQAPLDYACENAESTLQHFDDKLFKLKNLMNTKSALAMAKDRHEYMQLFIEQLKKEDVIKR
ncbi:HD domain-containing protein [Listeria floridensis FSL S10-1187]|uniref:HD domain-containing protein n=2 Tax=Listeria floridensis TaxID=1494962 RepID=A0ABN0RHN2_9LIST|nr:HD domain-containing protein [Listeria floridensis FSL S10-1187]